MGPFSGSAPLREDVRELGLSSESNKTGDFDYAEVTRIMHLHNDYAFLIMQSLGKLWYHCRGGRSSGGGQFRLRCRNGQACEFLSRSAAAACPSLYLRGYFRLLQLHRHIQNIPGPELTDHFIRILSTWNVNRNRNITVKPIVEGMILISIFLR